MENGKSGMKTEEIITMWKEDSAIDILDLGGDEVRTAKLHAKYAELLFDEKTKLLVAKRKYKELIHEKREFLINPTDEGLERGWKIPERGRLLKGEVEQYLQGDVEILDTELRLGIQEEKVELLKSIMNALNRRGFTIKNILEDRKFMHGG